MNSDNQPLSNEVERLTSRPRKHRSRLLTLMGYVVLVLLCLSTLVRPRLPQGIGGWSNPPIYDYLFILTLGICTLSVGIIYSYVGWTRNEDEYLEWYLDQMGPSPRWLVEWATEWMMASSNLIFFSARFVAPIFIIIGVGVIGYMSYLILMFLLR